jgi:hypothetical protein
VEVTAMGNVVSRFIDRSAPPGREAPVRGAAHGHIALDVVPLADDRSAQVHTFWTVETDRPGRPLLFRTSVHGIPASPVAWTWADGTTAGAGHAAVLSWVTAHGPVPPGMVDS